MVIYIISGHWIYMLHSYLILSKADNKLRFNFYLEWIRNSDLLNSKKKNI